MSLRCKVRIVLDDVPQGGTKTVLEALGPDNIDFPDGLSLGMRDEQGGLVLEFAGDGNMSRLAGTIDEVLEHMQLALRVTGDA